MKIKKSLISASMLAILLSACGSGTQGNSGNSRNNISEPGAIVPPSIIVAKQSHGNASAYTTLTDNMYYTAYLVTNKGIKSTSLSSVKISGTDMSEFDIESNGNLYPAGTMQCTSKMVLAPQTSCEILVKLTNPKSVTLTKKLANLEIISGGIKYAPVLSKSSYAYVTGDFSQVYANPSASVTAYAPVSDASSHCGLGNYRCPLLEFNLENHSLVSIMTSDFPISSLALANNGVIYAGGQLTQANSGTATISQPGVGSLLVGINPALSGQTGAITDILATNGFTSSDYPSSPIYTLAYNNNRLYIAGGFQQMAGVGDGLNGYPIVNYDLTQVGVSAWTNAFVDNVNNPNLAVSAMGFNNNAMYVSGQYGTLDNITYLNDESTTAGNFVINSCTSSDNGLSFSCDGSYANLDSTVNSDPSAYPQAASSLNFSPDGTLYAAGGFSQINGVGNIGEYMIATLAPANSLSDAWSALLSNQFPDNVIGATVPYADGKYFVGGFFSSIGGIATDANQGICGAGALSYSGTNSCLLAQYDGTQFKKLFTTDGWINTVVFASKIGS